MNPSSDSTPRRRGKQGPETQEQANRVEENGSPVFPTKSLPAHTTTVNSPSATTTNTTISVLQIWAPTLLLIFGGCCSNVYTLESLISASPTSGSLITFFQFLIVSLFTLPRHLSPSRGLQNLYLKERSIPLRKWIIYTVYFLSINVLNNLAFRYKIGVPLHIILRSAGPVTTMLAGRLWKGKRYARQKIVAVVLLFCGVVLAAVSDAWAKQGRVPTMQAKLVDGELLKTNTTTTTTTATAAAAAASAWSQSPGFALLASALILSACMGLFTDDMYATHGRSGSITAESLFYSHAMSLPYFLGQLRPLYSEFTTLITTTLPNTTTTKNTSPLSSTLLIPPLSPLTHHLLLLAANATTQLLCIIGVNRLSAQSSALTVSIVLNIRKLVSLVLSIWLFGNSLPVGVLVGAAIVFVGGGLYALPVREGRGQKER